MSDGFRIEIPVNLAPRPRRRRVPPKSKPAVVKPAVPRLARLLTLAHKWERFVQRREIEDYVTLARLTRLTRSRIAQICGLAFLAPDIQEAILDPLSPAGRIPGRVLRRVLAHGCWEEQRREWQRLTAPERHH